MKINIEVDAKEICVVAKIAEDVLSAAYGLTPFELRRRMTAEFLDDSNAQMKEFEKAHELLDEQLRLAEGKGRDGLRAACLGLVSELVAVSDDVDDVRAGAAIAALADKLEAACDQEMV